MTLVAKIPLTLQLGATVWSQCQREEPLKTKKRRCDMYVNVNHKSKIQNDPLDLETDKADQTHPLF